MKRILAMLLLIAVLGLTGCGKYTSHYNATAFVHSNESDAGSAFMNFWKFEGNMVFRLKCKEAGQSLAYTAKLETGGATVYYDNGDGKTELCAVSAGDETQSVLEGLKPGTVYVIVEADGHCEKGDFHFDIQ